MAMHEIESWAELSLRVVAGAEQVPGNACELAYTIYAWQDMFDCGYTVLRLRDELKKIGFLAELRPDELPGPIRRQVEGLEEGGFLDDDQSYFDADEKRLFVTAGSATWDTLAKKGLLPVVTVRELSAQTLTLTVTRLAKARGDEIGDEALALWYALLPALLMAQGEEDVPGWAEEARALCATERSYALGEAFGQLPQEGDEEIFDESAAFWYRPYLDWKQARAADPQAVEADVIACLQRFEWKKALTLAGRLDQAGRLYYTAFAAYFYRQITEKLGQGVPERLPEEIVSLEEAADIFASLEGKTDLDVLALSNLAGCRSMLGQYDRVVEPLARSYRLMKARVDALPDERERRFNVAALTPAFYRTLDELLPGSWEGKAAAMATAVEGLPPLPQARAALQALLEENWDKAWMCRVYLAHCDALDGDYSASLRQLGEAARLRPDDEEIQSLIEETRAKLG